MKKSLLVISVILLIAGLFISCNSEAAESGEDLVYVKFADDAKGLNTEITPWSGADAPAVNTLKWFYKATKQSGAQTGAQSNWKAVNNTTGLSGTLGPFSVGYWKFELIGCTAGTTETTISDSNIVYVGASGSTATVATEVKLTRGTNNIDVAIDWNHTPVAPNTIGLIWDVDYPVTGSGSMYCVVTATVGSSDSSLASATVPISNNNVAIEGSKSDFAFSSSDFTPVTVKFEVYDATDATDPELKVAENSVTFPGLKGSSVTISGTLDNLGYASVVINNPTVPAGVTVTNVVDVNTYTVAYIIKDSVMYGFDTLETAIAAADEGDTVGLLKDVNLSSMLQINKSITLDGNSHTINSSVGNTSIAILFYYGGAYYSKENTFYDNPDASDLENMELATPVVNNLSVSAPDAKYGIVFEGFVNATISNTDVTSNVTADGCGVTICGFNDTTGKTSLYQSFLTADNLRTNTNSGLDADWKNVGVSSQMYGVLSFNSGSSYAQGNGRAIGSYSSPSTSIISSGTFTGKIVAMQTTSPYNNSKYYSYDTENHKYTLNESSVVEHNVIQITGGTFTNTSFVVEPQTSGYIGEIIITGGTFDANPSDYVPEGYHATGTSGTWTVSAN